MSEWHSESPSEWHSESLSESGSEMGSNTRLPDYQTTRLKDPYPQHGQKTADFGAARESKTPEPRIELRDYQRESIRRLRVSLGSGNKHPMLQIPTGGGKTLTAAEIIRMALAKGKRVAFCVPAVSLIDQTVMAFAAHGILDVGVMQSDHPMTNPAASVQVVSIQTLERRAYPDVNLVIVDEAHRIHKVIRQWMSEWSAVPFIGLSATPWAKGLGKMYDDLIIAATTQDMIDRGYLSPFRVFAPSHPDLAKVKTTAGDYQKDQLSDAMKPLVGDAVEHWLAHGRGEPTICFAVDRAHAKKLQSNFQRHGVTCGYIDAYTDRDERKLIADAFHEREIEVVVNVGCLTTGVDWDVRCIVLCRPTKSEMLFVQMIGRGLRTADGKDECLIFDHSDTHERLGFVTDIHYDELDDGRPKESAKGKDKDEPLPKACSKCSFVKPPKVAECPACGFKPEKQSDIVPVDGELREITGKKKKYTKEEKQKWHNMLVHHAMHKGYRSGWVAHKFREKFGVWPKGMGWKSVPPDMDVNNWIKSQMIRAAKAKEKRA